MAEREELSDSKWRDDLTYIKSEKSRIYPPSINQCRIYTSMDITTNPTPPWILQPTRHLHGYYNRPDTSMDITTDPIAAVKGKGRDDQCEVVGQHSFTSPTGCRLSAVARVCEVLWQATTTANLMPVSWLWCQSSVRLP